MGDFGGENIWLSFGLFHKCSSKNNGSYFGEISLKSKSSVNVHLFVNYVHLFVKQTPNTRFSTPWD